MAAVTRISASCLVVATVRCAARNSKKGSAATLAVVSSSASVRRSRSISTSASDVVRLVAAPKLSKIASSSALVVSSAAAGGRRARQVSASVYSVISMNSQLTAGDVLIQTDQNGQNTHVCVGDSVVFNFTVVKEYIARKAVFSMKRSKNSTSGCTVSIYNGANGSGPLVVSSFTPVSSFSQQWTDMVFVFDAPLSPGNDYSLVVSSTTSCSDNNDSFFIKAGAIEVVDMAGGAVISNGYSIETKKPRCLATMVATATRIRNASSSAFCRATLASEAFRGRFAVGGCSVSSSMDSYALRRQEVGAEALSEAGFSSAARLLAAAASYSESSATFDSELTGGLVADNLVLNYNLVQPESFTGEGADTVFDIVENSDMRLFPKPAIEGLTSPDGIGHWDVNQGTHRRIYPNFPFYFRSRYGRKNSSNRILQVGPYFSDFAFGTIKFNAVNSYGITLEDLSDQFPGRKVSAFMWAYPTRDGVLLSEQGSSEPNTGWHYSQIEVVDGTLKFGMWSDGGIVSLDSSVPIEYFHWYYVGFTYDGSVMRGYVSGDPAGSVSVFRSTPYGNGYGLYYCLGHEDSTNMGDGRYGGMRFGQMHVYSDTLTDEEVYFNWYNTRARYEDPEHYNNPSVRRRMAVLPPPAKKGVVDRVKKWLGIA